MKLSGYIKPYTRYSFTIPVYADGKDYFFHSLDTKFRISGFVKTQLDLTSYLKFSESKTYNIEDVAPIVFVGESDDFIQGNAESTVRKICTYLERLETPRKHLYNELIGYAELNGVNIDEFANKFNLKHLTLTTHPEQYQVINQISDFVDTYLMEYDNQLKRKSSFKHFNKIKRRGVISKVDRYDPNKIYNYKEYILEYITNEKYTKAYLELLELLKYQISVGNSKYIVKSLCDISSKLAYLQKFDFAKSVNYIANLFNTNDYVIKNQYAEIIKSEGNLAEAKKLYKNILKLKPNDVVTRSAYAEVLKSEGDLDEAKKLYLEIIERFPYDIIPKCAYAEILKMEGNISEAKGIFFQILERKPKDKISQMGVADCFLSEGKFTAAKEIYLKLQSDFPEDIASKNGYANVLKAEGKLSEAKKIYREILKNSPDELFAKLGLLNVAMLDNDIDTFNKYMLIIENPITEFDYHFYHINILYSIKNQNLQNVEKCLLYGINNCPFSYIRDSFKRTLAYIKIIKADFKELLTEINGELETNSSNAMDNVLKTHIYSENSDIEKAHIYFEKIKHYETNSLVFESASLLSELYNLNGLPKKGLSKGEISELLLENEFKTMVTCIDSQVMTEVEV